MNGKPTFVGLLFGCFMLLLAWNIHDDHGLYVFDEASRVEDTLRSDIPQHIEELNNDFKGRTCVLPRRTVQVVYSFVNMREQKGQKTFLQNRLSDENRSYKINESDMDDQIIHFATLLSRNGYYVYALRKLLI